MAAMKVALRDASRVASRVAMKAWKWVVVSEVKMETKTVGLMVFQLVERRAKWTVLHSAD